MPLAARPAPSRPRSSHSQHRRRSAHLPPASAGGRWRALRRPEMALWHLAPSTAILSESNRVTRRRLKARHRRSSNRRKPCLHQPISRGRQVTRIPNVPDQRALEYHLSPMMLGGTPREASRITGILRSWARKRHSVSGTCGTGSILHREGLGHHLPWSSPRSWTAGQ